MSLIKIELSPVQAIRAESAIRSSIDRMRERCRQTDHEFGSLNNIYRDVIEDQRETSKILLKGLRDAGWPMSGTDCPDDPIDARVTDDVITPDPGCQ